MSSTAWTWPCLHLTMSTPPLKRLRRALHLGLIARDSRLRRRQPRDRHAVRRAGNVIHADAVAELHRTRPPAVLAADADFEFGIGLASQLDSHLHQLADAFLIEDGERIVGEDLVLLVVLLELRIVVAR